MIIVVFRISYTVYSKQVKSTKKKQKKEVHSSEKARVS